MYLNWHCGKANFMYCVVKIVHYLTCQHNRVSMTALMYKVYMVLGVGSKWVIFCFASRA